MKSSSLPILALLCFALAPLHASVPTVTGTYDCEGTIVETDSDYKGTVSLRSLLGLEFDLAQGLLQNAAVTRVEIEQRDRSLILNTKKENGETEWSIRWERNGGFEPTKEGVKLLIRPRTGTDLFMFTLSPVKEGAALLVDIQRVQAGRLGPIGKPVGKFLFLRSSGSP